jgi:hypothetical protein
MIEYSVVAEKAGFVVRRGKPGCAGSAVSRVYASRGAAEELCRLLRAAEEKRTAASSAAVGSETGAEPSTDAREV